MQANISLIRGDTHPLSIDSISIQGTEEKPNYTIIIK